VRLATHWATSRDLVRLRGLDHDAGTGLLGRPLGRAARGGAFVLDPVDAYRAGLVTNPNVVVAGAIGAGKSTVVKMTLARALDQGRLAVVVDPKGEYGDLARASGREPVRLGEEGWCDPLPEGDREARDLLAAIVAGALGSALSVAQRYELEEAWDRLGAPRPTRVLRALAEVLQRGPGRGGDLALALRRVVDGDLAGLFDGEGPPLRLDSELTVIDLSAQWEGEGLAVAALAAFAAARRLATQRDAPGYLVLDEAWAVLGDPSALAWLRGSWKLARSRGLAHVAVLHRFSDVAAVGDAGSAQRSRAAGLLRECETAWLLRQPPEEAQELAPALGLSGSETALLSRLGRGQALVRYGPHRSVVEVRPDARDREVIDTDAAMRAGR
jgi:type IV secretory pathway VirB4 component